MLFFPEKMRMFLGVCGLLVGLLWGIVSPAAAADFVVNETLSPGEDFYGIDASLAVSPFINYDNYSLTVYGDGSGSFEDVSFNAYGIYSNSATEIQNFGNISITAMGGTATALAGAAAGNEVYGIFAAAAVTNNGAINVTATGGTATASSGADSNVEAYGIYSLGPVTNGGALTVIATGGTAIAGDDADTDTFGIYSRDNVINSGAITVTTTGGTATDDASIDADADGYGIRSYGTVTNDGSITVAAVGGTATADTYAETESEAFGISSRGAVTNQGDITVTSTGGVSTSAAADGAYASAYGFGIDTDNDITNSGTINVTATGGTANATSSEPYALAIGLNAAGDVTNTGDIITTATYGSGAGTAPFSDIFGEAHALAGGIVTDGGDVFNSGNITATATASDSLTSVAIGIVMDGSGSLTNTGIIRTNGASRAYEVAVMSGSVSLIDSYNLNLDADPSVGSLYVAGGATLVLNDAMLSVTSAGSAPQMNTEYRIFDTDDGGTVSGSFGGLTSALNPDVVVLYHDQSTTTSTDDTVSLGYSPGASPQLEAMDLLRHAVTLSSDLAGQRIALGFLKYQLTDRTPGPYADSLMVANDATGGYRLAPYNVFFTPYYANIDKDASPAGYDADLVGFVTGIEHRAGSTLSGMYLGYTHAGLDFTGNGYSGDGEDQEVLSLGVQSMGNRGHWTWRGQLGGFYGWHDYEGLTGINLELRENADYNSYGAHTSLLGGYLIPVGTQIFLPEAGIEYLWLHSDSFTTDADDSGWDVHSSAMDEHQVRALASLRWLTRMQIGEVEMAPSLMAGVRCLLTDSDLSVNQSVAGSGPVTVKTEQDDVAGTVSASVRFSKEQLSSELSYGGEFGDETTSHSAWLRFYFAF
ncbi:autotransporter domain outer membrane protein [Syntrophotalea carbinolica DSM 2380]|uniref:Autotransporter domain outer membrane protein n=1 Tax=Syntrophotalea carbinolica (strain DSM 2380 / NBRC 103641 / GraBd1) TaxID=338963 RepID=Q3A5D2_SYNC1|nr:autotransporter domain-containing protein [Syntrophotalea carbinolica]ABA88425.1 autotransporter domain outer membrane protein [Syntrophotalea carbinolica DSM 2380]